MKTAVVFYTRDGSTKVAAKVIGEKFDADVFELEEAKKRGNSPGAFICAGFGAAIGRRSKLKNAYARDMKDYDRICIGTPIWAAKATPAVNAFTHALEPKGKEIIIFTLQADKDLDASKKGADILKKALEKKGATVIKIVRLCGAGVGETAKEDEIQTQIDTKLVLK
ncbi:MAG: hypothetical protein PHO15_06570 [Eubacteriales bacterium]|nr:hypothetical protein [Eubacteriales bacterium]